MCSLILAHWGGSTWLSKKSKKTIPLGKKCRIDLKPDCKFKFFCCFEVYPKNLMNMDLEGTLEGHFFLERVPLKCASVDPLGGPRRQTWEKLWLLLGAWNESEDSSASMQHLIHPVYHWGLWIGKCMSKNETIRINIFIEWW